MIVFPHVSGEHRGSSTDGFFAANRSASGYVRPLICMYNGKVGLSRPSIVEGLRVVVQASVGSWVRGFVIDVSGSFTQMLLVY